MKTVAVVGPRGAGRTLIATSLAIYLHLSTASAVLVDPSPDGRASRLVRGYAKAVSSLEGAGRVEYVVIDARPYDVPEADRYVLVVEPRHRPPSIKNVFVVVNKAGRRPFGKNTLPFDDTIHWAMSAGYPPIAVRNVKSWRRLRDVIKWIAESL
ncbi:MAG: hypothetical protein QW680_05320 [Pyrobaculum sp.]